MSPALFLTRPKKSVVMCVVVVGLFVLKHLGELYTKLGRGCLVTQHERREKSTRKHYYLKNFATRCLQKKESHRTTRLLFKSRLEGEEQNAECLASYLPEIFLPASEE